MARAIDADAIKEKFADILDSAYTDDYAKGFVAGLYAALNMPTLTTPNKWVSVEERLPDKPGHYLVCTNVNYWHGGCYCRECKYFIEASDWPIPIGGRNTQCIKVQSTRKPDDFCSEGKKKEPD